MRVLKLEGTKAKTTGACAAGFHETPWQPMCWVQIGLQEPHCAPPSWFGSAQSRGRATVSYGRLSKVQIQNGYDERAQKSGE